MIPHNMTLFKFICVQYQFHRQTLPIMKMVDMTSKNSLIYKRFECTAHLGKVMSMQHSFKEFSEKQRRVELKSVGNFVAKAVLVESAN